MSETSGRSPSLRDTGLIIGTDPWNISQPVSEWAQQKYVIWRMWLLPPAWPHSGTFGMGDGGKEGLNGNGEMEGMSQINLSLSVFLFLVFLSVSCLCLTRLSLSLPLFRCLTAEESPPLQITRCYLQKTCVSFQPELCSENIPFTIAMMPSEFHVQ